MAAQDVFYTSATGLDSPARGAFAITPDNNNDVTFVTRGIYVGTGGDLAVIMASGDAVTFTGLMGGTIYPLRVSRVKSTGSTASSLVGLY